MKLPRDMSPDLLVDVPCRKWLNAKVHQTGSHIILETASHNYHPFAWVPSNSIPRAIARHKDVQLDAIIADLEAIGAGPAGSSFPS